MILGTAAYMSPEQARGRLIDKRADIWAFGCLLYEMLTGRAAFVGEDVPEILAAVIKSDVSLELLPSSHADLRRVLARCLDRDLKRRYRDIGDVRIDLERIGAAQGDVTVADGGGTAAPRAARLWLVWGVAAVALVLAGALAVPAARYWQGTAPPTEVRFEVPVPTMPNPLDVSLSPDGKWIAYVAAAPAGETALFLRPVDSTTAQQVAGSEGAQWPFWSPDSRAVGFGAAGELKKADVTGGPPQRLCDLPGLFLGGTWSAEDVIVFSARRQLYRVSAQSGQPESLPLVAEPEILLGWPSFLPDSVHFLFTAVSVGTPEMSSIRLATLDSADTTTLMPGTKAVYASPGRLLYQRGGSLFAQPFDADEPGMTGEPVRVVDDVLYHEILGGGAFAVSENGALVFRTGEASATQAEFVWFDREGNRQARAGDAGPYGNGFKLAPDEHSVAVTLSGDIWIMEWARGVTQRFHLRSGQRKSARRRSCSKRGSIPATTSTSTR